MSQNAEAMTLEEMKERFHGQWLAVRVTERDVCLLYAGEPIPEGYGALY